MTLLDVINPGDKIDIHLADTQHNSFSDGFSEKMYKSNVMDMLSEHEIEIAMPMEGGKMVLFQKGQCIDMIFYSRRGLYQCLGVVLKRYKHDNLFLLSVAVGSELVKFQRREFFRMNCMVDLLYYMVPQKAIEVATTEELITVAQEPEILKTMNRGMALDISGGGIRFSSPEKLEAGSYILMDFHLANDRVDADFFLTGQIIASEPSTNDSRKYINRIKFIYKDLKDRESIVQFVFEEERRMRRKENG